MKLIAVVDNKWGIGRGNGLLFRIEEDMRHFRSATLHHTVVMGKNTLLSFPEGKPLKDRTNIVLSTSLKRDDCTVAEDLEDLIERLKKIPSDDVYVIGGEAVYKLLLPYCETALITKVDADGGAETFFANLDEHPDWRLADAGEPLTDHGYNIRFCVYRNAAVKAL